MTQIKIRYGFVTNSSASSFILKISDTVKGKDDVYILIKNLYKNAYRIKLEYTINLIKLFKYDSNNLEFDLNEIGIPIYKWHLEKIDNIFRQIVSQIGYENLPTVESTLNKDNTIDNVNTDKIYVYDIQKLVCPDWFNCENYNEYISSYVKDSDAPFLIYDHRVDNVRCSDICSAIDFFKNVELDETDGSADGSADELDETDGNDFIPIKYKSIREEILSLGEFGIYSEDGVMPNIIVNQLISISAYGCNHIN